MRREPKAGVKTAAIIESQIADITDQGQRIEAFISLLSPPKPHVQDRERKTPLKQLKLTFSHGVHATEEDATVCLPKPMSRPPSGAKGHASQCQHRPPNATQVTLEERIRTAIVPTGTFEIITANPYKFWCKSCHEQVTNIPSRLKDHIASSNHSRSLETHVKNSRFQQSIENFLRSSGESIPTPTLDDEANGFRLELVRDWIKSGLPIEKLDIFRPFLEKHCGQKMTSANHLRAWIPVLLRKYKQSLAIEVSAQQYISIAFDGTPKIGECFGIIVMFLNETMTLRLRFGRLQALSSSLNHEEISSLILCFLSRELQISSAKLISCMSDTVSANMSAITVIKSLYRETIWIGCISHAFDNIGRNIPAVHLNEFMRLFNSLFVGSNSKNGSLWASQVQISLPAVNNTRWWSQFERISLISRLWKDVYDFIYNPTFLQYGKDARSQLIGLISQPKWYCLFLTELAVYTDLCHPFVVATHDLEADSILSVQVADQLDSILNHINSSLADPLRLHNFQAVRRECMSLFKEDSMQLATHMIRSAKDYFDCRFGIFNGKRGDLSPTYDYFKACRLFYPPYSGTIAKSLTKDDIERLLAHLTFIQPEERLELIRSSQIYFQRASSYPLRDEASFTQHPVIIWWQEHGSEIPIWKEVIRRVLLVKPSSASVERAFSHLTQIVCSIQFTTSYPSFIVEYFTFRIGGGSTTPYAG